MPTRAPNYEPVSRHDAPGAKRYARGRTWADRWKWRLALLAAAVGGGWLVAGFVRPGGEGRYTHGPLAGVHAAWDANCNACHVPAGDTPLADIWKVSERWAKLTCEKCHAGPAHHATATDAGGCASCHHDHQGRMNSLVRLSDSHCTGCHADLKAHHRDGKTEYENTVTDFAGHPEFRSLRDGHPKRFDPSRRGLKFSHAVHLTPMIRLPAGAGSAAATYLLNTEGEKGIARYRESNPAAETLTCANCHQLDANDRAEGAYYRPVNFEAHCRSCHPLTTAELTAGGVRVPPVELPHGVQPAAIQERLRGEFVRRLMDGKPTLADRPTVEFVRLSVEVNTAVASLRADMEAAVATATAKLVGGTNPAAGGASGGTCTKCHDAVPGRPEVAAARVPAVWFEHAKFSHVSHRGTTCKECHPGAYATPAEPINEREPVNILGVASCQKCHAPAAGVRHACTDCHRYHNGDHPLQGRGAAARDPADRLTIEAFLRGGK